MPRDGDLPVTTDTTKFGPLKGRMTQAVCAADDLTPACKVVGTVMVGMASSAKGYWRASVANLEARTGLTDRSIRTCLKTLHETRWFTINHTRGKIAVFKPCWERAKPEGWRPTVGIAEPVAEAADAASENAADATSEESSDDSFKTSEPIADVDGGASEKIADNKAQASEAISDATSEGFSDDAATSEIDDINVGNSRQQRRQIVPTYKTPIRNPIGENTQSARATLADKAFLDEAVEAWNVMAADSGLAQVQKLTDARKACLRARLKDLGGMDGWDALLEKVAASSFLLGQGDRGWKADFDFVIKESKCTKIMEGAFDDPPDGGGGSSGSRLNRAFDRVIEEPESPI